MAPGRSHRAHILDRMLAATARAHGMTVLTRNMADFKLMFQLVTVEER